MHCRCGYFGESSSFKWKINIEIVHLKHEWHKNGGNSRNLLLDKHKYKLNITDGNENTI